MKLIVDIPDKMYHMINAGFYDYGDMNVIIQNGTRLPDGAEILTKEAYSDLCTRAADVPDTNVGELISRQAVIDRINRLIEVEKKQGTDDWGYGLERVKAYEAMLYMVKSEYLHPSVNPSTGSSTTDSDSTTDSTTVEPEKCGDCISRQELQEWIKDKTFGDIVVASEHNFDCLPPVEPERKPGKWIEGKKTPGYIKYNCSECGLLVRNPQKPWYEYCPKCGADMKDVPETNDKDTESEDKK